jgi:hypothetical protein
MQIEQVLPIISRLSPDQRVQLVLSLGMPAGAVAELENMCESVGMPLNGGRATERGSREQRGGLGGDDDGGYGGAGALEDDDDAAEAAAEKPSLATVRSLSRRGTARRANQHAASRVALNPNPSNTHTLPSLAGPLDDEA